MNKDKHLNDLKCQKMYKLYPKDALVIKSMLKESGIIHYDPVTINYLLNFTYQDTINRIIDSKYYAITAGRKYVIKDDINLSLKIDEYSTDFMEEICTITKKINSLPLPIIKQQFGLRLPPDRCCLLSTNYKIKSANAFPASQFNGRESYYNCIQKRNLFQKQFKLPPPDVTMYI